MCPFATCACYVDGASATIIDGVPFGTCSKEDFDGRNVAVTRSPMQGGVSSFFASVAFRAAGKKERDHLRVSPSRSSKQGRLTRSVGPIHIRACLNQLLRFLNVSSPCDCVER
ncbi:hypothetical protein J2W49_004447 [Hydrogenophaga palleronii]|uniref:Uncharacterized protein n=1 Tax=Hydrogenophaga palleronii TaxID=65655 RepID=A0ABU1WT60_9BURK|nr:hypothetical protein [Hydrogenophaga palleronii]MDR7152471.1 hypothetical protein [Hydrogenophaga palleronii]